MLASGDAAVAADDDDAASRGGKALLKCGEDLCARGGAANASREEGISGYRGRGRAQLRAACPRDAARRSRRARGVVEREIRSSRRQAPAPAEVAGEKAEAGEHRRIDVTPEVRTRRCPG